MRHDVKWSKVKRLAREHNKSSDWVWCIHMYYNLGGKELQLIANDKDKSYIIIGIADTGEILAVTKTLEVCSFTPNTFKRMKKEFNQLDRSEKVEVQIQLVNYTINSKNCLNIVVKGA